jgi:hypothetical protein
VQNQADINMNVMPGNPGSMSPNMQTMPMMANSVVYPEVFYKLQPYIMMACDRMDTYGSMMPTQEMVEQMSDGIYDNVSRMYPEMAEYANNYDKKMKDDQTVETVLFGRGPFFGFGFRRRGLFRDLIDILLLSELTRRRRYYY